MTSSRLDLLTSFAEADGSQACREDPELFFPHSIRDVAQITAAKRVCAVCPVRRPCLAYALTHPVHGIWGGATESERRSLQRAHGLPTRVQWSGAEPTTTTIRRTEP